MEMIDFNYYKMMSFFSFLICLILLLSFILTFRTTVIGVPITKNAINKIITEKKQIKNDGIKKFIFIKNIYCIFIILCSFISGVLLYKYNSDVVLILFCVITVIANVIEMALRKMLGKL